MQEFDYQSHLVHASAERTACMDYWLPIARVSWKEAGGTRHSVLSGQSAWCTSRDEATFYAVAMARRWIKSRLSS
jgi:hypothetical protein